MAKSEVVAAKADLDERMGGVDASRARLRAVIRAEVEAGTSQSEVARWLGWRRQTMWSFIRDRGER
jgi:hypothetical protein